MLARARARRCFFSRGSFLGRPEAAEGNTAAPDKEEATLSSKRQQTMAKVARERAVKERRARKLEKKQAKKLAAEGGIPMTDEALDLLPPDLNARYVDGGPPEPVAETTSTAAKPTPVVDEVE